eukprot:494377-Amphidinium_carterae.1
MDFWDESGLKLDALCTGARNMEPEVMARTPSLHPQLKTHVNSLPCTIRSLVPTSRHRPPLTHAWEL